MLCGKSKVFFACSDAIAKLLPPHLSIPARKLVCEAEVLKVYNKLRGYTSQECMITLLDYISSWEDYGVTHFYGDVLSDVPLLSDSNSPLKSRRARLLELVLEVCILETTRITWAEMPIPSFIPIQPFPLGGCLKTLYLSIWQQNPGSNTTSS